MDRSRSWCSKLLVGLLAVSPAVAVTVPAGTELELRLNSKVASNASKPNDAVEAIVIAPLAVNGEFVVPAGSTLRGTVRDAKPCPGAEEHAILDLNFSELKIAGKSVKVATQISEIENARESVDEKGRIIGILTSQTISGRMDSGIGRVIEKHGGLGDFLQIAKGAVIKASEGDIVYGPGVEFRAKLTKPVDLAAAGPGPAANLRPVANQGELENVAVKQPFQTVAQNPPKPSDITNLMFVGSEEALSNAFQKAGWSTAAALSASSKLETFRAIAELRGYKEAPVSILMLDNRPPDLVFQKQNNTFAQRHHLRIWKRPDTFAGKPVWVCAATHDIGIDFSEQNRTFIHKIDSQIDRERAKVVNDLLLTNL